MTTPPSAPASSPAGARPALTAPLHGRGWASRGPLLLAGVALIGVLALGAVTWQEHTRLTETRETLARRLTATETEQRDRQIEARQNRETLDALQGKIGALEAQLAEMQSQQMAFDAMYRALSHAREERLLAEVEQELAGAAQQLQLAGNVEAALIALSGAEARLAQTAQPQFLPLRKRIMRDIERLKSRPEADVAGITLKLDAILEAIPALPLAFEQRPARREATIATGSPASITPATPAPKQASSDTQPPLPAWEAMLRTWVGALWHELRQLVHIERLDRPDPGLLAPNETFFLRENLKLRLLTARIALLTRDGRSFHHDTDQARRWLEQYFDLRAHAVGEARTTLVALGKLDITRTPGALNETLSALRNFKRAREGG